MKPYYEDSDGVIYCGDCLEVLPQLEDRGADLVLADPPYGTTACAWDSIIPLEPMWKQLERVIKPDSAIIIMASQPFTTTLISFNMKMFRYCLVWDKVKGTGFLNAKKMPMRNHEDIIVFYNKLPTYNPQMTAGHKRKVSFRAKHLQTDVYGDMNNDYKYDSTDRYPKSIQTISTDTQNSSVHPTQKPVALMSYLIKTYSNKGDLVLDFAGGSGTTAVSCKELGRKFIIIEISEKYCEIAVQRLKNTTPSLF